MKWAIQIPGDSLYSRTTARLAIVVESLYVLSVTAIIMLIAIVLVLILMAMNLKARAVSSMRGGSTID